MPAFETIDHVQLAMPRGREVEARAFYVGVLGMEELIKPPDLAARGGAWFASGEVRLHLGVDATFSPATKAHPALRCVSYATLVQRLRDAGYDVVTDGSLVDGAEHAYESDPFGNRLEFIESAERMPVIRD